MKTSEEPETKGQAANWELVKNRYLKAGLCHRCASQAAWGHQCGFTAINDPCDYCRWIAIPPRLIEQHGYRAVKWLARPLAGVAERFAG